MQKHAGRRWGTEPGNHAEDAGDRPQPQQLEGARAGPSQPHGGPLTTPVSSRPDSRVELLLLKPCRLTPGLAMGVHILPTF